jgi:hypothetical protein
MARIIIESTRTTGGTRTLGPVCGLIFFALLSDLLLKHDPVLKGVYSVEKAAAAVYNALLDRRPAPPKSKC